MKVLVTGSSGFIGSAVVAALERRGDTVVKGVRHPKLGTYDLRNAKGMDAVVHLAGARIGGSRWTAKTKAKILESRVNGTLAITEALCGWDPPPKTFICASAVGFYGTAGAEALTEESPIGSGFRAEVCRAWEESADRAGHCGARVVKLRTSIVLGKGGGLLPYLLVPARAGLSLRFGHGSQYFSWISLVDETRAILHLLDDSSIEGPVNLASTSPVTQAEFANELRMAIGRGFVLKVPATLLRLALGRQQADEVLLSSLKVVPDKLVRSGFKFADPTLEACLQRFLGKI